MNNFFDLEQLNKPSDESFDEPTKAKICQEISNKWSTATEKTRSLRTSCRKAWSYYLENLPDEQLGYTDTNLARSKYPRKPKNVRMGDITKAVETILSQQHSTTFPSDDRFFMATALDDFSVELQESYESLLGKQFRKANFISELKMFKLNQILDATACLHVYWEKKEKKKQVYERKTIDMGMGVVIDDPFGGVVTKTKNVVEYDGCSIKALNFDDWRVDPDANCIEDSYFLRRWYMPLHKIKATYPKAKKEYMVPYFDMFDHEDHQAYLRDYCGINQYDWSIQKKDEEDGKSKALLMVCYDDFIVNGELYENYVAVVLNDAQLLYFGKNPYNHGRIPYIVAPYEPIPGQILGKSAVHKAIPNAEYIDKVYQGASRILDWAKDPSFQASAQDYELIKSAAPDGKISIGPGMVLPTSSGLTQLNINTSNISAQLNLAERCSKTIEDLTGASPILSGESSLQKGNPASALEVDSNIQGASSRFQVIIEDFHNRVLEPLLYMVHENNKQYKTTDEYIDGNVLTPDEIKLLDFEFTITGVKAVMNKNRQINLLADITFNKMPMAAQAGLVAFKPSGLQFDGAKALEKILISSGLTDVKQIIQEVPQEQMAMQNMVNSQLPPGLPEGDIPGMDNNNVPSVPVNPNQGA